MQKIAKFFKDVLADKNKLMIAVAVIAIIIVGGLIYAKGNSSFSVSGILGMSKDAVAKKAIAYINDNKLSQTPAQLDGNVTVESGLFKFKIKIGTNSFDTYATKDGKLFFPQVFDMSKEEKKADDTTASTQEEQKPAVEITKTDSPMLDAYIVARCPFGLQMQRAMYNAITELPELSKYLKARYIGSVTSDGKGITAMHGEAEATENLRQICIRDEQASKYWSYVACQMKKGDTAGCEKSTGIDSAKLSACTGDPKRGVAYAKEDFALADKYNVSGSPTLMIGAADIDENKFGGRSADGVKSMVCAGFKTAPSFCSKKLSTDQAATSFSESATSGNSGSSGANCAPAQ